MMCERTYLLHSKGTFLYIQYCNYVKSNKHGQIMCCSSYVARDVSLVITSTMCNKYSSFGEIPQRNPSRASLALLVYQTDRRLELAWSRKDCYRSGEGSSDSNYYLQRWAGFPLRTRYRPTTNMLVLIGTMPGRQWTRLVDCDSSINSIRKAYPIKFREEFQ